VCAIAIVGCAMACAVACQEWVVNAKQGLSVIEGDATANLQLLEQNLKVERAMLEKDHQLLQREKEELEVEKAAIKEERAKFKVEKAATMEVGIGPNNLIGLNFRGEKTLMVKRSLLCQLEGSMLATMFSGRYEDKLDYDTDGNVFIDYPASVMVPLMDRLTLCRDLPPGKQLPGIAVPTGYESILDCAVDFFGLQQAVHQAADPPPMEFNDIKQGLKLSELKGWIVAWCEPFTKDMSIVAFMILVSMKIMILVGALWHQTLINGTPVPVSLNNSDELAVVAPFWVPSLAALSIGIAGYLMLRVLGLATPKDAIRASLWCTVSTVASFICVVSGQTYA